MDFDEEQNDFPGKLPEYGAIFMSNMATKRECFRQKLFGLPSSLAPFVRQVKAGMILFLFEYERRQLYGVFQACSDGAMNIVPYAYGSGKRFPAQVKFTTIWCCNPLSEHEFRDAIRDNYFSANKFNFGLSEVQVRHLLLLLSSRKLKQPLPLRQLRRSDVSKLSGRALRKVRKVAGNSKYISSCRVEIENDKVMDDDLESENPLKYSGHSLGNDKQATDNDMFPVRSGMENNEYVTGNDLESSKHDGYALGKEKILLDDGGYEVRNKSYMGNDLGPVTLKEHSGDIFREIRRVTDDTKFVMDYPILNKRKVDNNLGAVGFHEYNGNSLEEVRSVTRNVRFTTSDRFEHRRDMGNGLGMPILSRYPGNSLVTEKKPVADDGSFTTSDRLENGLNLDGGRGPILSTQHPSLYQSNLNSSIYSRNYTLDKDNSLVPDQLRPYEFSHSIEPQISKLHPTSVDDQVGSSRLPHDPGALENQKKRLPYFGINRTFNSVNERTPAHDSSLGHTFPFSRNHSSQFQLEQKALSEHPDVTSGIGNHFPWSTPNCCKCEYCMTGISSLRGDYLKVVDSADYEGYRDLSFAKSSLASIPVAETGNHDWKNTNVGPDSFSSKNQTFVSDYGYYAALDAKNEHKSSWHGSKEAYAGEFSSPNGRRHYLPDAGGYLESRNIDFQEHGASSHDIEYHGAFTGMYSGLQKKKRNSVFSRLTVPQAPRVDEKEIDVLMSCNESLDTSADDVMDMLHEGHYCWVKNAGKYKQPGDCKKFRNRKHAVPKSQQSRNESIFTHSKVNVNHIPTGETSALIAQEKPLLDFKRRSAVRKNMDETQSRGCAGTAKSDTLSTPHCKRRKLVRPSFSKNDPSNDIGHGDNTKSGEPSIESEVNGNNLSENTELQDVKFKIGSSGSNTDNIEGSKFKGKRIQTNCDESFIIDAEDGIHISQNVGIQNWPMTVSCGNTLSENVELPDGKINIGSSENYTDKNGSSRCEAERRQGNSDKSFRSDADGQHVSLNIGIQYECLSVSCGDKTYNAEEGSSIRDAGRWSIPRLS